MTDESIVETLNELVLSSALEWDDSRRKELIKAFREQRERWNVEQNIGSRKRVTSKQIETGVKKPKGGLKFADIKL